MPELSASELVNALAGNPLFAQLDTAALQELQRHVEVVALAAGETLVRKGDVGDCLYIVYSGQLGVYDPSDSDEGRLLRVMGRGEYVGEIALLRDSPRTATLRAQDACVVLRLTRTGFLRLLERHPGARTLMESAVEQRLLRSVPPPRSELLDFLGTVPLFAALSKTALADVEHELQWLTLAAGEYLFRQGDPADCLYLVISGRLRIVAEQPDGSETVLGDIGRGQCVGEFGLLSDEPRAATVRPLRDAELVRVPKTVIEQLLDRHPRAMLGFVRSIIEQARSTKQSSTERGARAIAIVPCGRAANPGWLVASIKDVLGSIGSVAHVTSQSARAAAAGGSDGDPVRLVRYLNELEANHRYVLYECDPELSAWTRRCLRQADRVLLVGRVTDDPRVTEIERELLQTRRGTLRVRLDLALLHPESTRQPTGTQAWLSPRKVDSHHHVRDGNRQDVERMVRRLSGRSVGLVLSGGAAHGFAHIGVIRALREHGIAIDQVGGTSMGSVIAALFALGASEKDLVDGVRKVFVEAKPLTDVTLPVASFLEGKRFANAIHELFGETLVEDLWLGYFCVSGNLTRGEPAVHESGALWNAVRMSCSIPGLVPPVVQGTDLHVDGGVANNLPDDVMRARAQGPVIAVDIGPSVDLSIDARYTEYPPAWKVLAHNVNPVGRVSVPTLLHILFRTAMLSSHGATVRAQHACALYLRPRVEKFPFLDFRPVEAIAEEGYRSTHEQIAAWKKSHATAL
ncbi:MAG TPA: cyclic nucleotide-binding and patatin-like phospholipase domain-containing protein [Polyangiales bacterium]